MLKIKFDSTVLFLWYKFQLSMCSCLTLIFFLFFFFSFFFLLILVPIFFLNLILKPASVFNAMCVAALSNYTLLLYFIKLQLSELGKTGWGSKLLTQSTAGLIFPAPFSNALLSAWSQGQFWQSTLGNNQGCRVWGIFLLGRGLESFSWLEVSPLQSFLLHFCPPLLVIQKQLNIGCDQSGMWM